MEIDFTPFLHMLENGSIWWRLEDAVKLGAGYLPVRDDEHNLEPVLRANGNLVVANAKTLLSEFSPAHYGDHHPRYLVRDSERYVEAHEFLDWLCRLAHEQAFPFPCALAGAVKGAGRRAPSGTDFKSLTALLDAWFEKSLAALPKNLFQRVEQDFFPMDWNVLSPNQRRSVALQWDRQNDPAMEDTRQYWWDFFIRMDGVKDQITHWQSVASPTAGDLAQKEVRLAELGLSLARMEHQSRLPQGDVELGPQLFNDAETKSRMLAEVAKSGHVARIIKPSVLQKGALKSNSSMKIGSPEWRQQNARLAANARHDKPGGSRDQNRKICEIWATGKFNSRDRCAEEECGALNMTYSAARNALKNTPEPKTALIES